MGKTGRKNKKYSAEFKISVIMDMRENHLGYNETVRKYNIGGKSDGGAREILKRWERIFLEERAEGLMKERRGKSYPFAVPDSVCANVIRLTSSTAATHSPRYICHRQRSARSPVAFIYKNLLDLQLLILLSVN